MNIAQKVLVLSTVSAITTIGSISDASAVSITLEDVDYNVTTIEGNFDDLESQLESQPWWGSRSLAKSASNQIADQLGTSNVINVIDLIAPYFAFNTLVETSGLLNLEILGVKTYNTITNSSILEVVDAPRITNATYAVIEPSEPESVPEPLTILGTTMALGFGALFKKKKNND